MTEYDFSPEAYDRYLQTQNRVASWVHHTEQHRQLFEAAVPGAPGVPPILRQPSPPLHDRYAPSKNPSSAYPKHPIYYRAPPSSSSSDDSYVHVPAPQTHRPRPLPPPIYASPPPPPVFTPFPKRPYPSPMIARLDDPHRSPSSPRRHHHRSQSHAHSHSYRPPPLVTPIYTSPPASPFHPHPGYTFMSPRGYPAPSGVRPVPQHEQPPPPNLKPQVRNPQYNQPPTPPASSLTSSSTPSSAPYTPAPTSPNSFSFPSSPATPLDTRPPSSGLGGSHPRIPPLPRREDQNQKQRSYHQYRVHSGPDPLYTTRDLARNNTYVPYSDYPLRQTSRSSSQSRNSPASLRPQPYRDLYERTRPSGRRDPGQPKAPATGLISISVPAPRHPADSRELAHEQLVNPSSRTGQMPTLPHAAPPTRHTSLLGPRPRASARV